MILDFFSIWQEIEEHIPSSADRASASKEENSQGTVFDKDSLVFWYDLDQFS